MVIRTKHEDITGADFTTGLIAALAASGVEVIHGPRIAQEEAFVAAFERIEQLAEGKAELRFWITTNPYHGGCSDAVRYLNGALATGLLTNNAPGPDLRIKIDEDFAPRYFERLALGQEDYREIAKAFLEELASSRLRHSC